MARFTVAREGPLLDVAFDDGGMNLLSSGALIELRTLCSDFPGGARILVFRSARPGLFAAGADMAEMQRFSAADAREFSRLGQETFRALERLSLATVAIIDGDCYGGALDLALAFDFRFATARARFSHPGAQLGIVTGFGGTSRWRHALDPAAARKLFLSNPVIDSSEALKMGLVDVVGETFARELGRLAAADPATVAIVKELSRHAHLMPAQLVTLASALQKVLSSEF